MHHATTTQRVREFLEGPLTRPALHWWRREQFLSRDGFGFYFGVFDSFAQARRWLPQSPEFGRQELAREYVDVRCRSVYAYDYPVLWWLASALRGGVRRVLDLGGSVGVHYYAYRRYLDMPPDLRWLIVEVPMIVSIGQALAAAKGASALGFSADLRASVAATDAALWLSAGALQYMEDARPAALLRQCASRPAHLLLNKLPLYEGEDFVTAQNLGFDCFAPVQVFNRERFVGELEALGYTLRDQWAVHERSLYLPGFPERSFPSFTGLYFTAVAAAESRPTRVLDAAMPVTKIADPPTRLQGEGAEVNAKRSLILMLGTTMLSLSAAAAGIEGPTWRLTSVQGLDAGLLPTGPKAVNARFEGGRVSGFSGCNRFFGSYTLKPDQLVVGALAGSMMACGGDAMKVEGAVHRALAGTFRPVLSGDDLTLMSARGEPVMRFKAEPAPRLAGLRSTVTGFNNGRQAVVSPMRDTTISMSFDDRVVRGFSGCNTFRAGYTVEGQRITVGPIATTRRACDQAVMEQERQFLAALKSTTTWDFSGALLDMHRPDGERTLTGTREAG